MPDTDPAENGRISSAALLRDLSNKVSTQGEAVAAILPQLTTIGTMIGQVQTRLDGAMARMELNEQQTITLRAEIDNLKARPIAPSPEAQGESRALLQEVRSEVSSLKTQVHDNGTKVSILKLAPPIFNVAEQEEIRRLLKLALKHQVDDAFDPSEMQALHDLATQHVTHKAGRTELQHMVHQQALATIASVLMIAVLIPLITHLMAHWH